MVDDECIDGLCDTRTRGECGAALSAGRREFCEIAQICGLEFDEIAPAFAAARADVSAGFAVDPCAFVFKGKSASYTCIDGRFDAQRREQA